MIVNNKKVEDNEDYGRTINQCLELFVLPVYKRQNLKFEKEKFRVALVELFDDGRKPKIKLNKDVPILIEFNKRQLTKEDIGKPVSIDLREIKNISWHENLLDKDSARILVLRFNLDWWVLNFDFRYNQGTVKEKVKRAKEFLSACKTIIRKKELYPHVLVYLLWSTAELIVDSMLLLHAQKTEKNHRARNEKIKSILGESLFSAEFSTLFLLLSNDKNPSRYGDGDYAKKYPRKLLVKHVQVIEQEISRL